MDGGYLEAEMMAKAGADFVVVMGRAHEATVRRVVDAARHYGIKVMGDNMVAEDRVKNAQWLESLGCDYIIHHIGFDERGLVKGLSPMDELDAVVDAVNVPVQAVGGLTIPQAIECPAHGAPLVVLGAPLVIDANEFKTSSNDLHTVLREISTEIRKTPLKRWTAAGHAASAGGQVDGRHATRRRAVRPRSTVAGRPARGAGARDRARRRAAGRRRRLGLRLGRAPGLPDALVAGERAGDARPRVRWRRRPGRRGREGASRKAIASSARPPPTSAASA